MNLLELRDVLRKAVEGTSRALEQLSPGAGAAHMADVLQREDFLLDNLGRLLEEKLSEEDMRAYIAWRNSDVSQRCKQVLEDVRKPFIESLLASTPSPFNATPPTLN